MTTQSWQNTDIYGNPVQIDADEDGVADDPAAFDAAWKAGVFHEIRTFRQLMPNAIVSGHSMDIYEPGIAESVQRHQHWLRHRQRARRRRELRRRLEPLPRLARPRRAAGDDDGRVLAPGPDRLRLRLRALAEDPASTLEFARTYYPYVRFGLAFTLMNDGYFAHEYGDTWHGNDWWYDELDFNLGYPLGPAQWLGQPGANN